MSSVVLQEALDDITARVEQLFDQLEADQAALLQTQMTALVACQVRYSCGGVPCPPASSRTRTNADRRCPAALATATGVLL